MYANIKEWLSSKKTKALIAAEGVALTGFLGGSLSGKEAVLAALVALGVYIIGQGAADWGTGGSSALKAKSED